MAGKLRFPDVNRTSKKWRHNLMPLYLNCPFTAPSAGTPNLFCPLSRALSSPLCISTVAPTSFRFTLVSTSDRIRNTIETRLTLYSPVCGGLSLHNTRLSVQVKPFIARVTRYKLKLRNATNCLLPRPIYHRKKEKKIP